MKSDGEVKHILVTAALPYANGELHLGHLKSTYLPADIYTRYHRLKGSKVIYVCGSDQHGTPIEIGAKKSGKPLLKYIEYWHRKHHEDLRRVGISFDEFYKTHSKENEELTKLFLRKLLENGYLYKSKVKVLYCPYDKMYLSDRYVRGTCPYCGAEDQYGDYCEVCGRTYEVWELKNPRCAICGRKPEVKEVVHYKFKLSKLAHKVEEWLKNNKRLQREVVNYVLTWFKAGIRDWDITRENYWGIEIPFEKGKYVYVWFDAPIGYIAATVKWAKEHGEDWEKFWKGNAEIVHFIGKDIIYHHFIFWPAMLIGTKLGFSLPSMISVRGFLTLEGRKFSKSRGWYITIGEGVKFFKPDYLRFYLTLITPHSLEDTDFNLKDFKNLVNSGLCDTIGNLSYRVVSLVHKKFSGRVPEPSAKGDPEENLVNAIKVAPIKVGNLIESFDFKRALEEILSLARIGNKYMNLREPWKNSEYSPTSLYLLIQLLKSLSILLYPFTPNISESLWTQLKLNGKVEEAKWEEAGNLTVEPGHEISPPKIIAPRISDKELRKAVELLGRNV
ncbi:MAG: methionine--tRNA ligase [Thermofilum sp. ex4484_15]|nr:MAG: methionine--tRNA ligase [Thermofilum sp. ex4484_15]